jgi:hypothetical protein
MYVLQPLALCWSTSGRRLVVLTRDRHLRTYDPRDGVCAKCDIEDVIENIRAARICFACDDRVLICVSFSKFVCFVL